MRFLTPDPQNRVNKNLIQNATSDVRCSFCNKKNNKHYFGIAECSRSTTASVLNFVAKMFMDH